MSDNKPLISVIVPVYNVEQYLDKCLESIVNQTYRNLEILLVDDGSPDNCPTMCDEWADKDLRVKVIHKKNGGLSSARNTGLDHCSGEYVGFIDSDDWIDLRFFETLYTNLEEDGSDISVVGVWKVFETYQKSQTEKFSRTTFTGEEALHNFLYFKNNLAGGVTDKIFKTELFDKVRFPEGLQAEDRYVHAVIYSRIQKLSFDPVPMYYYLTRENSICTSDLNPHTFDRIKIVEMICEYLGSIEYSDKNAIEYFKMKGFHDVLYKLLTVKAPKKYIVEYKRKTRKYFWKTMRNKEVGMGFKIKYM
jgi:glycosyltransferase involved in cell wall biosynthesis